MTAFVYQFLAFAYQVADVFAFLVLAAGGLAIIFGMMGIINMAHGEFITCGAYVTTALVRAGLPLPVGIVMGALFAGVLGIALERTIVRRFYNRPIDSLVVTWGVSLIATQGALLVLGSAWTSVGTPLGSIGFGDYSFALYRLVMLAVAIGVLVGLYLLFMKTRFGVHARATMQNPAMARALGVPTERIYAQTFGLGAALAGLAGGVYAPTLTLSPTMGTGFVVESFVTVVVGGADVLTGTAPASAVLAIIRAACTAAWGQVFGLIGLLVTVCIVIRVLPEGFSGWLMRRRA
ncbi:MAG: branched-chain amino acid ABC transporter permease [Alphaproteobacteria bacterium]|nr:branched-chain amino acid ABC transporter permease [Alphaproteobacteria bacterium]